MNKNRLSGLLFLAMANSLIIGMAYEGPMNSEWFYSKDHPFSFANELHQNREWAKAEKEYNRLLEEGVGSQYDQDMACLNLAACQMAQRKPTKNWRAFDPLIGIKDKKLSQDLGVNSKGNVLVQSHIVGIGDIFHFFKALVLLKERTGYEVTFSVRNFLKDTLKDAANAYDITLVGEKDPQPDTMYQTHLISLLGHLNIDPAQLSPEKVIFTAPEKAIEKVKRQVDPILANGQTIGIIILGEDRPATFIGGKKLPYDIKQHGRHLNSQPFLTLLKKHPELIFLDCGTKNSKITVEQEKERIFPLADEEQPFDTIVGLGRIMSKSKKGSMVGIGADNGPTNVFARSLDIDAQDCMAFIIPNGKEYDMRMEGIGSTYRQMLSNCRVYKCEKHDDQEAVIEQAYRDMTGK